MTDKTSRVEYEELQQIIRSKDYAKAKKKLEELLEKEPENVIFLLDMAYVQGNLGEDKEAIKKYEKVIEIAPTNPSGYAGIGFIYRKSGETQKAIEYFQKSLERDPSNTMVHFELGEVYFEADDYESAKKQYVKAVQFSEDEENEAESMHRIIQTELGMEQLEKAIGHAKTLIKSAPELVSTYNLLGTAYYLKGEFKSAVEAFEKYLEKVPDDFAAKNLLKKAKAEL